jgi:putative nucleotidyltransferase with HDIG domain
MSHQNAGVFQRSREPPVAAEPGTVPSRVRIPIRAKITFPYLLLALALAVGAAYLITQIVFDTIDARFTNQLIEVGKLTSEKMAREEKRLQETLRLLSYSTGIQEAVKARNVELIRDLSFGIIVNNKEEEVNFLDVDGNLILTIRHSLGDLPEIYEFTQGGGNIFMEWLFVRELVENGAIDQPLQQAGMINAGWVDLFYLAGPLHDSEGEFSGVILIGKTLSSLGREMRNETGAQVTFYDTRGIPIASTLFDAHPLDIAHAVSVLENKDAISLKRNVQETRDIKSSRIDYAEILGPWENRDGTDIGVIGSSLAKTFIVTTNQVTRTQIAVLVGLALGLTIFLGINVASLITNPLLNLVEASKEVAGGNLDIQVDLSTNDEVEILANSFNTMVSSLNRSRGELIETYNNTLEGWSLALELRDKETEGHTRRVTNLTEMLAKEMGIKGEDLEHIRRGALLHDIGKMGVPDGILLKEGPLDDEEWAIMRKHPTYANNLLSKIDFLIPALDIPHGHHERWDGKGYPRQLKGTDIPLGARIFSVVDVWDAITSDRPYREAMSREKALDIIRSGSGSQFDPQVVEAFFRLIEEANI